MRKPAIVQRVINSQINEIVGGGQREAIPPDMLPAEARPRAPRDHDDDADDDAATSADTPPFGVSSAGHVPKPGPSVNRRAARRRVPLPSRFATG